jgi:hypothetical protein
MKVRSLGRAQRIWAAKIAHKALQQKGRFAPFLLNALGDLSWLDGQIPIHETFLAKPCKI